MKNLSISGFLVLILFCSTVQAGTSPWFVEYFFPGPGRCEGTWRYKTKAPDGAMIFATKMRCGGTAVLTNDMHVRVAEDQVTAQGELGGGRFRGMRGACEFSATLFGTHIKGGQYTCEGRGNEIYEWQAENVNFPETKPN